MTPQPIASSQAQVLTASSSTDIMASVYMDNFFINDPTTSSTSSSSASNNLSSSTINNNTSDLFMNRKDLSGQAHNIDLLSYDFFDGFDAFFDSVPVVPGGTDTNNSSILSSSLSSNNSSTTANHMNMNNFLSFPDYDDDEDENWPQQKTLYQPVKSTKSYKVCIKKSLNNHNASNSNNSSNNNSYQATSHMMMPFASNNANNLLENSDALIAIRDMAISGGGSSGSKPIVRPPPRKHKTSTSSVSSITGSMSHTIKKVAIELQNSVQNQQLMSCEDLRMIDLFGGISPNFNNIEPEDWDRMLDEDCISRLTSDFSTSPANNLQHANVNVHSQPTQSTVLNTKQMNSTPKIVTTAQPTTTNISPSHQVSKVSNKPTNETRSDNTSSTSSMLRIPTTTVLSTAVTMPKLQNLSTTGSSSNVNKLNKQPVVVLLSSKGQTNVNSSASIPTSQQNKSNVLSSNTIKKINSDNKAKEAATIITTPLNLIDSNSKQIVNKGSSSSPATSNNSSSSVILKTMPASSSTNKPSTTKLNVSNGSTIIGQKITTLGQTTNVTRKANTSTKSASPSGNKQNSMQAPLTITTTTSNSSTKGSQHSSSSLVNSIVSPSQLNKSTSSSISNNGSTSSSTSSLIDYTEVIDCINPDQIFPYRSYKLIKSEPGNLVEAGGNGAISSHHHHHDQSRIRIENNSSNEDEYDRDYEDDEDEEEEIDVVSVNSNANMDHHIGVQPASSSLQVNPASQQQQQSLYYSAPNISRSKQILLMKNLNSGEKSGLKTGKQNVSIVATQNGSTILTKSMPEKMNIDNKPTIVKTTRLNSEHNGMNLIKSSKKNAINKKNNTIGSGSIRILTTPSNQSNPTIITTANGMYNSKFSSLSNPDLGNLSSNATKVLTMTTKITPTKTTLINTKSGVDSNTTIVKSLTTIAKPQPQSTKILTTTTAPKSLSSDINKNTTTLSTTSSFTKATLIKSNLNIPTTTHSSTILNTTKPTGNVATTSQTNKKPTKTVLVQSLNGLRGKLQENSLTTNDSSIFVDMNNNNNEEKTTSAITTAIPATLSAGSLILQSKKLAGMNKSMSTSMLVFKRTPSKKVTTEEENESEYKKTSFHLLDGIVDDYMNNVMDQNMNVEQDDNDMEDVNSSSQNNSYSENSDFDDDDDDDIDDLDDDSDIDDEDDDECGSTSSASSNNLSSNIASPSNSRNGGSVTSSSCSTPTKSKIGKKYSTHLLSGKKSLQMMSGEISGMRKSKKLIKAAMMSGMGLMSQGGMLAGGHGLIQSSGSTTSGQSSSRRSQKYNSLGYSSDNPAEKRAFHILSERQRRNDLKKLFETLRMSIPALSDKQKASKLTILKAAVDHLLDASHKREKLQTCYEKEKQRHNQLVQHLRLLQQQQQQHFNSHQNQMQHHNHHHQTNMLGYGSNLNEQSHLDTLSSFSSTSLTAH